MKIKLICDDCINAMKDIPEGSVSCILTDLPYGKTGYRWDSKIPFEELWEQFKRIRKNNAAIILFGQEPFSSSLRLSNLKEYRYDWVWEKERPSNVLCMKKMPGKVHENICIFYAKPPVYNPQMSARTGKAIKPNHPKNGKIGRIICSSGLTPTPYQDNGLRYPRTVIKFKRDVLKKVYHPTQKPVELLEYLIRTYTNEGDTVLDATMGGGSTGVACVRTDRAFIGIEKDEKYFDVARDRINRECNTAQQEKFKL